MELYNTIISKDIQKCIDLYLKMKEIENVDNVIKRKLGKKIKRFGGIGDIYCQQNPINNPFPECIKKRIL